MTNITPAVPRVAVAALLLLPLLGGAGGCVGPCDSFPIVLLPVALAAQPVIMVAKVVDQKVMYVFDNTDFSVAGRVVDDQGNPLDGVTIAVHTWRVVGRGEYDHSYAEESETVTTTSDGSFDLKLRNRQTVDLRFVKAGYVDGRMKFEYDVMASPPGSSGERVRGSDDCSCDGSGSHEYALVSGGRVIEFERGTRARAQDLTVVIAQREAGSPAR